MPKLISIISLLICSLTFGQTYFDITDQYIENPSFEEYTACPPSLSYYPNGMWIDSVVGWYATSQGTSDYYNVCSGISNGVPNNFNGYQESYHGDGYCGFLAYAISQESEMWSEYIQTELIQPLKPNVHYRFSMQICRNDYGSLAAQNVGVNFSQFSNTDFSGTQPIDITPTLLNNTGFLTDSMNWVRVSGEFKATGNENYLTIGWFGDTLINDSIICFPPEVDTVSGEVYLSMEAYYFVDSIKLYEIEYSLDDFNVNVITPNNDGINDVLDFSNFDLAEFRFTVLNRWGSVVFETNSANQIWGGNGSNDELLSDGTYFYILMAITSDEINLSKNGFIEIIR